MGRPFVVRRLNNVAEKRAAVCGQPGAAESKPQPNGRFGWGPGYRALLSGKTKAPPNFLLQKMIRLKIKKHQQISQKVPRSWLTRRDTGGTNARRDSSSLLRAAGHSWRRRGTAASDHGSSSWIGDGSLCTPANARVHRTKRSFGDRRGTP
jgi:hypothetical protein